MKQCQCGQTIPTKMKIGGKTRNLQNRTKCLTCLPFGTSLYRPKTVEEHRARKARNARDRYYKRKENGCDFLKLNRENRKKQIISALGGKCQLCGYNRLDRNLAFHHLRDKEFDLSSRSFNFSWSKLLPELSKCILVCHNCHGEIHAGIIDQSVIETLNGKVNYILKDFQLGQ